MKTVVLWMFIVCFVSFGCTKKPSENATDSVSVPRVVVTCEPWRDVCRVLLPEHISVNLQTERPSADVIRQMQESRLIVTQGAGCEPWFASLTVPLSIVVMATAPIKGAVLNSNETMSHQHGPTGAAAATNTLFHTWLDPALFSKQLDWVVKNMVTAFPKDADQIQQQAADLRIQLQKCRTIATKLRTDQPKSVAVADAELAYFAAACGCRIVEADQADWFLTIQRPVSDDLLNHVYIDPCTDLQGRHLVEVMFENYQRIDRAFHRSVEIK